MSNALLEEMVKTPKTIAEQVYDLLKKKILSQEIMPEERLLENAVCKILQVSRTPVREAFRLLQQDGLVERIPQGGVRVTDLSLEELREVSALRTVLEVYAAELACENITEKDIEELENIMKQTAKMFTQESESGEIDVAELSRLNTVFHDIICNAAHSGYLSKILEIVRLPILRFRPFSLTNKQHRTRGWEEHKAMIKMLRDRDKTNLKKLVAKHVDDVTEAVAQILASKQGD
jgi:DNA-binding GntR family transcriptional regulator